MVTTGQEKIMHNASGTGIKLTLAKLVMKETAPARPCDKVRNLDILVPGSKTSPLHCMTML